MFSSFRLICELVLLVETQLKYFNEFYSNVSLKKIFFFQYELYIKNHYKMLNYYSFICYLYRHIFNFVLSDIIHLTKKYAKWYI